MLIKRMLKPVGLLLLWLKQQKVLIGICGEKFQNLFKQVLLCWIVQIFCILQDKADLITVVAIAAQVSLWVSCFLHVAVILHFYFSVVEMQQVIWHMLRASVTMTTMGKV